MKTFDVKAEVESQLEHNQGTFLDAFGGAVAAETRKVGIKHELTCRPHTFSDDEKGEVADKLIIEIDFSKTTIQPHTHFEDDFCRRVVDAIQENVNGLMENAE